MVHYKEAKGILLANNTLNLYRGCTHGCIYCDTRSNCYQFEHDFEDIEVKVNAVKLLEEKLSTKRKKVMVSTGSMTDPYIHLEEKLNITKQCLEVIEKYGHGVTVLTKSDRVLRDIDILKRINDKSKAVVQMTLTTHDDVLCKKIEPRVSVTSKRVEALKQFHQAGIPTVVWFTPILPFINDTEENIEQVVKMCAEAGVGKILFFGAGMTLRAGSREYYYEMLDKIFPGMAKQYQDQYGDRYIIKSPHTKKLMHLFYRLCDKYSIESDSQEIFQYLKTFPEAQPEHHPYEQIQLF